MKKISSRALLITGLVVEFGNPIFIAIIALMFPNMSGDFAMPIIYFFDCAGVIILTLSLAKKRLERGTIKAENLLKALTPAQICLITSMVLLVVGVTIGAIGSQAFGGMVGGIGIIGVFVAIILAIVRAVKIRQERKAREPVYKPTYTPATTNIQFKLKEYCERCGAAADKGTLKELNGHRFCSSCTEIMAAAQSSELLKPKAKCCGCGNEFEKSKMIFVDDHYICNNCFRSRYAGSVPIDDNTGDL